nr:hypothetical protein [Bacteroidota bacterium]
MKNLTLIILIVIMPIILLGQINEENCISCIENRVNFKDGASAVGTQNVSTGINSFAAGYINEATGNYSLAMPFMAKALGERSIALGYNAIANGAGSIALGTHSLTGANAMLSIAIGSFVSTAADNSIAIGLGKSDSPLTNTIEESLMIGFNTDIPSLFIGPSVESGTPGNIGIGTTSPSELLEINGNLKVNNNAIIAHADIDQLSVSGELFMTNSDITGIKKMIGYNNSLTIQNNYNGNAKMTFSSNGNIGVG